MFVFYNCIPVISFSRATNFLYSYSYTGILLIISLFIYQKKMYNAAIKFYVLPMLKINVGCPPPPYAPVECRSVCNDGTTRTLFSKSVSILPIDDINDLSGNFNFSVLLLYLTKLFGIFLYMCDDAPLFNIARFTFSSTCNACYTIILIYSPLSSSLSSP